ncbi:hypothetical protein MC7420_939 [Coleofasciculus chthonoplastes PCC 7420]|uniref:Uncharacterized protein n=1 Tax=Coleofasciculus chthonoplastes PCC 7420 TaxID=118168 RepID=B4W0A5_9CYAN|nr:hypothetical protein MC7420_939 [Coleofasciculus chthonoplastes PCC 7420]
MYVKTGRFGFHSTCFPSEWEGVQAKIMYSMYFVSIQLVFPASGKTKKHGILKQDT